MASTFRTRSGDVLDHIVWNFYGRQDAGLVEFVLEANYGLADHGAILPAGLLITLPDAPEPNPKERIQLFS